jgi:hypothetical protein
VEGHTEQETPFTSPALHYGQDETETKLVATAGVESCQGFKQKNGRGFFKFFKKGL